MRYGGDRGRRIAPACSRPSRQSYLRSRPRVGPGSFTLLRRFPSHKLPPMATEVTGGTRAVAESGERRPRTIGRVWREALAAGRTDPAYLVESAAGWDPVTWQEA